MIFMKKKWRLLLIVCCFSLFNVGCFAEQKEEFLESEKTEESSTSTPTKPAQPKPPLPGGSTSDEPNLYDPDTSNSSGGTSSGSGIKPNAGLNDNFHPSVKD